MVTNAAGRSTPVPTFIGGAYLHFSTLEGVELWIQVSPDKELIGCNPHFAGLGQFSANGGFIMDITQAISMGGAPLDGRLVGTIVSEDAYGCPIVFDVPDFRQYATRLTLPARAKLQLAALPYEFNASANRGRLSGRPKFDAWQREACRRIFISFPAACSSRTEIVAEPPTAQAVLTGTDPWLANGALIHLVACPSTLWSSRPLAG